MDFFHHRYYKINKVLLTLWGLWPYESVRTRCSFIVAAVCIVSVQVLTEVLAAFRNRNDPKLLVDSLTHIIFALMCGVKLLCTLWNSPRILNLLDRIRTDWQVWSQDREVNILHHYASQGRKMTIAYAVTLYSDWFIFLSRPIIPKIFDVILRNGSAPGEFPVPIDYYHLDMQKYYFVIMTYMSISSFVALIAVVGTDTIFIVYVQHVCGVFAALGHKLERTGKNKMTEKGTSGVAFGRRDVDFEHLAWCIDRHNTAIEYAEVIDETYSWYFFIMVGLNMFFISSSGLQIVKNANEIHEIIQLSIWLIVAMVHLYIEAYMSQLLIDHSVNIRYNMQHGKWSSISLKAKKLLPLMMMRCNVPCKLTAGKLTVMSLESFTVFLKASVSYFTLLSSTM